MEELRKKFPHLTDAQLKEVLKLASLNEAALILVEIGKSISSASADKIQAAITSMKAAIDVMTPLIATDTTESAVELGEAAKVLATSDSYDNLRMLICKALRAQFNSSDPYEYYSRYPYVTDMFDGYAVYSLGDRLYQCDYTYNNDVVTIGDSTEVKVSYVPISSNSDNTVESKTHVVEVSGQIIPLREKAVKNDGTARVKIISPGWGSSGYYSTEMLKRDGPNVFTKGLHMYMNHPTEEEANNRPERDLRDLAGVINSDVLWEDASSKNTGEGLYADVKIFPTYKEFIDEAAPHIGVSIRASGIAEDGEAEGKKGYIVKKLDQGFSVDYVTMAGRGGEVLSLYESARKRIMTKETVTVDISQEDFNRLQEAAKKVDTLEQQAAELTTQNARMNEAMLLSESRSLVSTTLSSINMPDVTRNRLIESCARNFPVKEDKSLDREKLVENVKAAALAEMQYLESVTGSITSGRVVGITPPEQAVEVSEADVDAALNNAWQSFGLSEKASQFAVNGRS